MARRRKRLEWFAWFPEDFRGDEKVSLMSPQGRGAYRELLDHAWRVGPIADPERCLRAWGWDPALWEAEIRCCWDDGPDGWTQARLERERELAVSQSNGGKAGADRRWGCDRTSDRTSDRNANAPAIGGAIRDARSDARFDADRMLSTSTSRESSLRSDSPPPTPPPGGPPGSAQERSEPQPDSEAGPTPEVPAERKPEASPRKRRAKRDRAAEIAAMIDALEALWPEAHAHEPARRMWAELVRTRASGANTLAPAQAKAWIERARDHLGTPEAARRAWEEAWVTGRKAPAYLYDPDQRARHGTPQARPARPAPAGPAEPQRAIRRLIE